MFLAGIINTWQPNNHVSKVFNTCQCCHCLLAAPTYGDLIDLLQECEDLCGDCADSSIAETLYSKFTSRHPNISIGRPKRLYDAVMRIVAPTRPSLRGGSKISGPDLVLHRTKEWIP